MQTTLETDPPDYLLHIAYVAGGEGPGGDAEFRVVERAGARDRAGLLPPASPASCPLLPPTYSGLKTGTHKYLALLLPRPASEIIVS